MTTIEKLNMNVKQANADFTAIKNKIIENGVEVAEGTRTADYANKIDDVYSIAQNDAKEYISIKNSQLEQILYGADTGGKSFYDEFWDEYQNYGNRTSYIYGFAGAGFNTNNFYPKYDIKPVGYNNNVFYAWETAKHTMDLKQRLLECGVVLDTSGMTNMSNMFTWCRFATIPTIDCTGLSGASTGVFSNCFAIEIEKIITKESVTYTNWFINTTRLTEIRFEGVIGQNIDFSACPLTKESIESIMSTLSTTTSEMNLTLSQAAVNNAFTTDEWTSLVNTRTNWTISLV